MSATTTRVLLGRGRGRARRVGQGGRRRSVGREVPEGVEAQETEEEEAAGAARPSAGRTADRTGGRTAIRTWGRWGARREEARNSRLSPREQRHRENDDYPHLPSFWPLWSPHPGDVDHEGTEGALEMRPHPSRPRPHRRRHAAAFRGLTGDSGTPGPSATPRRAALHGHRRSGAVPGSPGLFRDIRHAGFGTRSTE